MGRGNEQNDPGRRGKPSKWRPEGRDFGMA